MGFVPCDEGRTGNAQAADRRNGYMPHANAVDVLVLKAFTNPLARFGQRCGQFAPALLLEAPAYARFMTAAYYSFGDRLYPEGGSPGGMIESQGPRVGVFVPEGTAGE